MIPGGSEPDWGPAGVPAARADQGGGPVAGGLAVTAGRARLRKALKAGLTVKVTVPGAGKVAVAALRGGRKVASGKRTVSGGTASVKLRFTGQARRSLKRKRKVALALRVTFTPVSGTAQSATAQLTLKR